MTARGAAAIVADAEDDEAVAVDAELVFAGHRIANLPNLVAVKFDQFVALLAVQVIVLRIAVVVLVDGTAVERHFAQQARLDEFGEGTIDRGPADAVPVAIFLQLGQERFGIEMVVVTEDMFDDGLTLLRRPLAAALQKLLEPFKRRKCDFYLFEREIVGHGRIQTNWPC